ncbi:MAG TPA: hypothetical protein PLJ16_03130 [Casimicrobium huifangae]|jgi:hypothetical protein|uniref:hypothetical protein n=1 Tax=Casimicrobium huifangae TaxID=2591109 RepID=UPI002CB06E6F|nr:hypothetical protein [Casimicrobium huifangae]HQA34492.1 hypothetical protein [Casimicrobium huifangae]HQD64194.1 hypothetical protein [Casimicrobium huifangae]
MAVPVVVRNGTLFFWNLSANVGRTSPNRPDDVQLVQLGYACAAKDPAVDAKMRPIFAAVVPGAPYTGLPNDPLTIAIIADQKDRRGSTQDGHISVLTNFAGGTYGQDHPFIIVGLNFSIRGALPETFPRIDKHPLCPPQLKAVSIAAAGRI